MAQLTVQRGTQLAGLIPTLVAAGVTTDAFANDGQTLFVVENSNAATRTVSVAPVQTNVQTVQAGPVAVPTITNTIAATTGRLILGPFPTAYNDANGNVNVTYSANAGLTVGAVKANSFSS